jgi:hypothetical protein
MESNKLTIFDKSIPIKAIPEKSLDQMLQTQFMYWLSNLLSLKADSEEKVLNALPAIKKHFWSLGMPEVKRAFELYADGELRTQPRSNYFDRILVGQIFKEYRDIKNKPKKVNEEEYKDIQDMAAAENHFEHYRQGGNIHEQEIWLYDYIFDFKNVVDVKKEDKMEVYKKCLKQCKGQKEMAIRQSKRDLLHELFDNLINKGLHLKNLWK